VLIDTGTYEVILETAHALPDTLHDVFIGNDTLIDFIFYYQFLNPDTINLEFFYKPISDSLGPLEELTLINKLNGRMGCVIGIDRAIRSAYSRHNRNVYHVTYRAPIDSNYYSWQVLLTANSIVAAYEYCFPEELDVHADYVYCLF
jgi:hypothetical protein